MKSIGRVLSTAVQGSTNMEATASSLTLLVTNFGQIKVISILPKKYVSGYANLQTNMLLEYLAVLHYQFQPFSSAANLRTSIQE